MAQKDKLHKRMIPFGAAASAALIAALALSACGPAPGPRPPYRVPPDQYGNTPRPEISRPDLIQPALTTIRERIRSYEAKLDEIRNLENSPSSMMIPQESMGRLDACKTSLLDILTNYDNLHKRLLRETNLEMAQNLANNMLRQVNRQDMQYLESDCNRLLDDLRRGEYGSAGQKRQDASQVCPPPPQDPYAQDPYAQDPYAQARTPETAPKPEQYGGESAPQGQNASPPAAPDPRIQRAHDAGDYAGVITLYTRHWAGARSAAPRTTWQYCQALLKNYQFDEARRTLSGLDAQLEAQGGDPLAAEVLRALGDLAFSEADYQSAAQYYSRELRLPGRPTDVWSQRQLAALREQNAPAFERSAYAGLLRSYLAYSPGRDGYAVAEQAEQFLGNYPASRLVANVNEIHRQTRAQADAWRDSGRPMSAPPMPEGPTEAGNTAPLPAGNGGSGFEPEQAPAAGPDAPLSLERRAARMQALREQFDLGKNQMASGNYDAAIETFDALRGTDMDAQARKRLNEAAVRAGTANRQQAAELFMRASQTRDTAARRKMLLQSRDLLREIPRKYPQAGLDDKVARNLSQVEAALRELEATSRSFEPPPSSFEEPPPEDFGRQPPVRRGESL